MEVILREDVEKLGARGAVVNVAPGYARNFLLPKRLAVLASGANKKIVEQVREAALRRDAKEVSEARDLAKLMEGLTLEIKAKAGEQDQLFGSVTSQDIVNALEARKFTIDRRKIVLPEPIKTLGDHKAPIRLHREVTVEVAVQVVREEE
jgi:large subunit ribosomal protein L9